MAVIRKSALIIFCLVFAVGILVAGGIIYFEFRRDLKSDINVGSEARLPQSPPPASALPPPNPLDDAEAAQQQAQASAQARASAEAEAKAEEAKAGTQAPMFSWPPPEASASYVLPRAAFAKADTLGDVAAQILAALASQGYVEHSYFATPHGVALVTRLERINADGTRAAPRWPSAFSPTSLIDLLRGLFFVAPGNYRVIVFIIENQAFQQSAAQVSEDDAKAWLRTGLNTLPQELAQKQFLGDCTALIYEFMSTGDRVKLVDSELSGLDHLKLAGLQSLLATAPH
jgi:hypothetical protein